MVRAFPFRNGQHSSNAAGRRLVVSQCGQTGDQEPDGTDGDDLVRYDSDVTEDVEDKVKEPEMWDVLLHNDDYTTKWFVVEVLRSIFQKNAIEATKIMTFVHKHGKGVVGTYTWDIAQSKVSKVHAMAKQNEFPLRCSVKMAS